MVPINKPKPDPDPEPNPDPEPEPELGEEQEQKQEPEQEKEKEKEKELEEEFELSICMQCDRPKSGPGDLIKHLSSAFKRWAVNNKISASYILYTLTVECSTGVWKRMKQVIFTDDKR